MDNSIIKQSVLFKKKTHRKRASLCSFSHLRKLRSFEFHFAERYISINSFYMNVFLTSNNKGLTCVQFFVKLLE